MEDRLGVVVWRELMIFLHVFTVRSGSEYVFVCKGAVADEYYRYSYVSIVVG